MKLHKTFESFSNSLNEGALTPPQNRALVAAIVKQAKVNQVLTVANLRASKLSNGKWYFHEGPRKYKGMQDIETTAEVFGGYNFPELDGEYIRDLDFKITGSDKNPKIKDLKLESVVNESEEIKEWKSQFPSPGINKEIARKILENNKELNEYTDYDFDPREMHQRSSKNIKQVEKTLKKAGFSKISLAKAQKQIREIDLEMDKSQGVMFVHVQYHVIETDDGKKLFIHQTQYYHRAWGTGGVNLTALYVTERPHWPVDKDKDEKEIGRAVVLTDDFLDGLRKANVIDRAS